MKMTHLMILLALGVSANAAAHDPSLHAKPAAATDASAKPKPTTCAQLADTQRYAADLKDPAVKALKDRCDAEKKAAKTGETGKKQGG